MGTADMPRDFIGPMLLAGQLKAAKRENATLTARVEAAEAVVREAKEALAGLDKIITDNVRGTDLPHRMKIGDEWHQGPVVDATYRILIGLREIGRTALARIATLEAKI